MPLFIQRNTQQYSDMPDYVHDQKPNLVIIDGGKKEADMQQDDVLRRAIGLLRGYRKNVVGIMNRSGVLVATNASDLDIITLLADNIDENPAMKKSLAHLIDAKSEPAKEQASNVAGIEQPLSVKSGDNDVWYILIASAMALGAVYLIIHKQ